MPGEMAVRLHYAGMIYELGTYELDPNYDLASPGTLTIPLMNGREITIVTGSGIPLVLERRYRETRTARPRSEPS